MKVVFMSYDIGQMFIFWGYGDDVGRKNSVFEPGNFGVVVGYDYDAAKCLLTDETGKTIWCFTDLLFDEEFIPLVYAPRVPLERLPAPYGTMIGEPY